jgi:hypothetical protein
MNTPVSAMDIGMHSLTLSGCLAEIATHGIPWAGDPGAGFDTGLYAVLDHAEARASAVLYYRPQDQQFLMYVYLPSGDEGAVTKVADAVVGYMKRGDVVHGRPVPARDLPGAVLCELDAIEAHKRLRTICEHLNPPIRDPRPFAFH